jgi:hypothetical protein
MKCKNCKHWQGYQGAEWGDCYRILLELQPDLGDCYTTNEYGTIERFFDIPFDPHDAKYWNFDPVWKTLYDMVKIDVQGVRCIVETRDDIVYDGNGGERTGRLKLRYYQTHKDFQCEEGYDD